MLTAHLDRSPKHMPIIETPVYQNQQPLPDGIPSGLPSPWGRQQYCAELLPEQSTLLTDS